MVVAAALPVLPEQGEVTCRIELGSGRLPYHDAFRVDDIDAGDTGTGEAVEDRTVAVEIPRHPKVMVFPVPGEDIGTLFVPSFRAAARYGYDVIAGFAGYRLPYGVDYGQLRLAVGTPGGEEKQQRRPAGESFGRVESPPPFSRNAEGGNGHAYPDILSCGVVSSVVPDAGDRQRYGGSGHGDMFEMVMVHISTGRKFGMDPSAP